MLGQVVNSELHHTSSPHESLFPARPHYHSLRFAAATRINSTFLSRFRRTFATKQNATSETAISLAQIDIPRRLEAHLAIRGVGLTEQRGVILQVIEKAKRH